MYGQGNYAPQFANASQRPMPPPQEQHRGFVPPPFPQRPPLQSLQLIQQAGPPHAGQPGPSPSAQAQARSIPPPMPQPGQPGLNMMSNPSQSYFHQNPISQGNQPTINSYPVSQQTSIYPSHMGTQNVHYAPPPIPPPVPPPTLGPSRTPPPPLSQPQQIFRHPVLPRPPPPPPQFTPLPQLPPARASLFRPLGVEWTSQSMTEKSNTVSLPSQLPPLPPSSPPPPPPPPPPSPPLPTSSPSPSPSVPPSSAPSISTGDLALQSYAGHNSCQTTHSDAADTVVIPLRTNDSRDEGVKGSLVYDGSASGHAPFDLPPPPPEARDEKTNGNMNSVNFGAETCSPDDSDIDMEDDITQFDKDQLGFNSAEEQKHDWFSAGNEFEMGKQDAMQGSRVDQVEAQRSPVVKSRADVIIKSEKSPDQILTDSPFRMIQNYASDDSLEDDIVPCKDFDGIAALELNKSGATTSHGDTVRGSLKSETSSEVHLEHSESNQQCESTALKNEVKHVVAGEILSRKGDEFSGENAKAEAASTMSFDSSASFDIVSDTGKDPKEDKSTSVKVDEFGRLVRDNVSESESDDSDKKRRHRRGRSTSSSQSPQHRRRRRTPLRRKERRSRSRSWSPRKRRSRSRSPFRHSGVLDVDRQRRGRAKMPECFDFLKGKCYRGASCRYLHHDSDKYDGSRHARSKQRYSEAPQSLRNSESDKEYKHIMVRSPLKDKVMVSSSSPHNDMFPHEPAAAESTIAHELRKTDMVKNAIQPSLLGKDDKPNNYNGEKLGTSGEVNAGLFSQLLVQEAPCDPASPLLENVKYQKTSVASFKDEAVHHALPDISAQEHHVVDFNDDIDRSAASNLAVLQTCLPEPSQLPVSEPYSSKISNEASIQENPLASGSSSAVLEHHFSQPPPPPPLQPSHGVDAPQALDSLRVHTSLASTVDDFHLQSSPVEFSVPYQAHLFNQQFYPVPPNQLWSTGPPYVMDSTIPGTTSQFQQGNLPVMNELARPVTSELPGHSQVKGLQHHSYSSLQDPLQPPLHEVLHNKPLHASSILTQQFGGPSFSRDDSYAHLPSHGTLLPSLFPPGNTMSQSTLFHEDMAVGKLQSLASDNRPANEVLKSTVLGHLHYQQQQPLHGLQHSAPDKIPSHLADPLTFSRYPADVLNRNQPSSFSDIGGSRITSRYNPYASTFDQPLNSNFSSRGFRLDGDSYSRNYDAPYGSVASVEGQGLRNFGLKHIVSSPNSIPAVGQALPKSGGDQYDPFEPGSESSKKQVPRQNHAADNTDIMIKLSGSHKPLDMLENKKGKEDKDAAATISMENDEFGETADAEVGVVENGSTSNHRSTSNHDDEVDVSAGEIEIDQVKSKDKSMKSKDSRSMKLFKAELANFVKEVLKPSWRQGNMSKEAFKTIVKKTVDKVSSAMKNHRMPKSKEKISLYIDSSHRKLTQLVEGYVNKYAKA
ncbi:hypothetical protein Dimus_005048 [Dionaea muscipula]